MEDAFKDADVLYPKSWGSLKYVTPQSPEGMQYDKMEALFNKNTDPVRKGVHGGELVFLPDFLLVHCGYGLRCFKGLPLGLRRRDKNFIQDEGGFFLFFFGGVFLFGKQRGGCNHEQDGYEKQ